MRRVLNRNFTSVIFSMAIKEKETNCSQCVAVKNDTKSIKGHFLLGVPPDWFHSIPFRFLALPPFHDGT